MAGNNKQQQTTDLRQEFTWYDRERLWRSCILEPGPTLPFPLSRANSFIMAVGKKLTKEDEILLQNFSRTVSTKSSALFYANAFFVSAIPLCKHVVLVFISLFYIIACALCLNQKLCVRDFWNWFQGCFGGFTRWTPILLVSCLLWWLWSARG